MSAPALRRTLLGVLLTITLFSLSAAASAHDRTPSKIPATLQAMFAQGAEADYLVFFNDTADLRSAPAMTDKVARKRFVYDRLREQAMRTQSSARTLLTQNGIAFRQHYLLNVMEVHSGATLAQQLAALPAVARLSALVPSRATLPQPESPISNLQSPTSIEWGVTRVRAPDVWSTYNVRGKGIVVGTADTGVQWDHPALKAHYRGWNGASADHTYNWHDAIHAPAVTPCGVDAPAPCDDFGHGTHVTGTLIGDDGAGNQIGVAPGAQWIGCRNMANGDGTIVRYIECFEFMLAPYPQGGDPLTQGRPDLAADIVNNSWTCTASEGCDSARLNALLNEVQKLNAAGILVVAAAGNAGPSCATIDEPPAIYAQTLTVGAVNSSDQIASFSSRGPVISDGSGRRKPDVSAPGVSVRSSYPTSTYTTLNGTSMASPHTSGVAALLWSAVPSLNGNIAQTISIIETSADPRTSAQGCGGDASSAVPNNVYGHGIVNALAAVQYALALRSYYIPIVVR